MLDHVVLSCIFNHEYMNFTTCRLKAVSSAFCYYSQKYKLVLNRMDFDATVRAKENRCSRGMIQRKVDWNSKLLYSKQ